MPNVKRFFYLFDFMLIGIDASRATKLQLTGTEYYSQEIIKHLAQLDHQNEYILYSPTKPLNDLAKLPKNFRWEVMPFPRFWSQIRLAWALMATSERPMVVFEPAHTIPLIHPVRIVVTVHDLGFKHFPKLYTPFERLYHNFSANFSVKHADHIITVSEYTKQDILKHYKINPNKISVIYHGFDNKIFNPNRSSVIGHRPLPFLIQKPFILFIGRLEEKKNLINALEAFRIFKGKTKLAHQLVLAGKPGYGFDRIEQKLRSLPATIRKDIILPGYISIQTYAFLLKQADLFFFPSNFEGFGMPVIEAMACGTPVACSNVTSLPEVAGDAAMFFDPKKPAAIADALERVLTSPKLQLELRQKGIERAPHFSWAKAAQETLDVLLKTGSQY